MPKDDFDFEDPFELNGMAFLTPEDTTNDMAETFIEEFMRMGHGHWQILALFRNPHYLGPHMALEKRGEPFVRDLIREVFARWGRSVSWPDTVQASSAECGVCGSAGAIHEPTSEAAVVMLDPAATDPMGAVVPRLNV